MNAIPIIRTIRTINAADSGNTDSVSTIQRIFGRLHNAIEIHFSAFQCDISQCSIAALANGMNFAAVIQHFAPSINGNRTSVQGRAAAKLHIMDSITVNGQCPRRINFAAKNTCRIGNVHSIQRQIRRIIFIANDSNRAIVFQVQIFPIKG